ncbi:hypothetical protein [Desulfitobacterium chlororespirans]|uniref:Uncharacterized protein n=1 Tax=Desulfitobacterium chlororespirans DSM 11544 TaxID=1121395 RepID=A0A1M7UY88_9FIRM|nr:hypothetical protein [Desulfitobacterium chlororespirans]SHN87887.1 hypothetical protein SAMN02745215_05004 [Desulfitobacterium chlororespirans DSM 11544]
MEQMSTSDIIALISALAAIGAAIFSRRSNSIAQKANETANKANELADENNRIAREALEESKKQAVETFPRFELISLVHNPGDFEQYTNEEGGKENYISLSEAPKLYEWVKETRHSLSFITHNGKEYLLINILDKQETFDKIRVYIGIIEVKYKNHRRDAERFTITKSRSQLLNGDEIVLQEKELPITIKREEGIQTITINIAYAHSPRDKASIITDKFYGYKEAGEIIDFLDKPTEASNIFNFKDSSFIGWVEDSSGTRQRQVVHMKMNSTGRVFAEIDDDDLIRQPAE